MNPLNEPTPKWLSTIKTPMIFNAFSVISISSIATAMAFRSSTTPLAWIAIAWIIAMTLWVNWQAKHDPRAMMYGPNEYLEESKLEHQRRMAAMKSSPAKGKQ
jgi:hypothetical protein